MSKLRSSIRIDIKNIGSCPFCITQSLKLAVIAGAIFAVVLVVQRWWQSSASIWISGVLAATFVSIWLLHVAVYGLKAALFAKHRALTETDGLSTVDPRRRFLVTFAKAAIGVTAGTALSLLSIKRASAQMHDCGYGTQCNLSYEQCCWGLDHPGGNWVAWCCPKDTRCGESYGCRSSGN